MKLTYTREQVVNMPIGCYMYICDLAGSSGHWSIVKDTVTWDIDVTGPEYTALILRFPELNQGRQNEDNK